MAANSVSSLATACIQLYSGMGSERLVEQFVITYTSYLSLCLLACLSAAAAVLKKRRGDADAKNTANAALSHHIPYIPSFEHLLFLAPLFLATSNLFLLVVRVYDIRARPFPYTSQQQFELASLSSQMFTTFLVLIPIGTLFSSFARMVFMFRLVLLCQKIGHYTFDAMKVTRRIAVLIFAVSAVQFVFSWVAAAFSQQHVPVFNRGAEISALMPSSTGNTSSSLIMEFDAVKEKIGVLNRSRNIFLTLTFVCDIVLYSIGFCVFTCSVFICRRAISHVLSKIRVWSKNGTASGVAESLEQHQERMLILAVWNIVVLFLLVLGYSIMVLGLVFLKAENQCAGTFEAGPCSSCQTSLTLFAMIFYQSPIILPVLRIAIEPLTFILLLLGFKRWSCCTGCFISKRQTQLLVPFNAVQSGQEVSVPVRQPQIGSNS